MKFNNSAVIYIAKDIAHYDENAESFRIGTKDHDVSQNIAALIDAFPKKKLSIFLILVVDLAVTCVCLNLWDTGLLVWMAARSFAKWR